MSTPAAEVRPASRILVTGANGQLGRALAGVLPAARAVGRQHLDVGDAAAVRAWSWSEHDVVLNTAAYTAVDLAETPHGRVAAWAGNAGAAANLCRAAREHGLTVVQYSTDYVFDGTRSPHPEDEPFSPLGVYGQTKAAADLLVTGLDQHYVLRTSWVIGDGHNFVSTMHRLAMTGVSPVVVADQVGRLTFADDLALATRDLLAAAAPYGTYNCTNTGPETSWYDVARRVFELSGRNPDDVSPTTTAEYAAGKHAAPRPPLSTLDLSKLESVGIRTRHADDALVAYVAGLAADPG